ncbi:CPBP family intramembrane metalloprotease [Oscillospiraceae bacterium OttesenSCG-928-G22]|nr:CPBP family intramembrane metalloprotease [Oscillospiraceae bacterium OttesenSCG-928-G22]
MKKFIASFWAICYIAIYFVCIFGASFFFALLRPESVLPDGSIRESDRAIFYIALCVIISLAALLILKLRRKSLRAGLPMRRLSLSQISRLIIVGVGLGFAMPLITGMLPIPEEIIREYEELVKTSVIGDTTFLGVIATVVLAPLNEELVFRAGVFGELDKVGVPLALFAQSLVFALIHGNTYQVISVFPAAIVLGLVYRWTDNLLASLLVHVVVNGQSTLYAYFLSGAPISSPAGIQAFTLVVAASVIGLFYALRSLYRDYKREPSEPHGGFDERI